MAVFLSPVGGAAAQFFTNSGIILSGGKLYTYAAGTTTPQATFTSSSGNTNHTNPIILDSAGRVPGGEIWLTSGVSYKFSLFTSVNVLLATWDNIASIGDNSALLAYEAAVAASSGSSLVGYLPAGTGAVATTVQTKLRESVSVKDFGAVGDGTTNDTAAIQAAIDYCLTSGNSLYVPPGNYRLTSQVNVALYSASVNRGLIIYGSGWASRFIIDHTTTGFYVTCSPSFTPFQAEFRDLYFTDGASHPAKIIWNNGAANTLVQDCIFADATVTYCVVNDNAYGLTLEGCIFTNIVGAGVYFALASDLSTYSFVNSIVDCDFSVLSNGVIVQGCNALWVVNSTFQECNIGFYANPASGTTTAFNITFDTCWFERNTTYDIQLSSTANYWCEASIRNCQFAGFDPTYVAHIALEQKSKVTIEGTPSGNTVLVSGSSDAAAVLIRATNFIQSGTFYWTSIEPKGDVVATTYKSLSGTYASAATSTTVTLTTLPTVTSGTWLVCAQLDGSTNVTAYSSVGVVCAQSTGAVYTAIRAGTGLTISVSGLNLQGNQTSGGPYSITWSLTRLT